jgi:hypothetical protein
MPDGRRVLQQAYAFLKQRLEKSDMQETLPWYEDDGTNDEEGYPIEQYELTSSPLTDPLISASAPAVFSRV